MFEALHTLKLGSAAHSTPQPKQPTSTQSPAAIAQKWIASLNASLESGNVASIASLLHQDVWWRDWLALSWDLRTVHGLDKLSTYISDNLPHTGLKNLKLREVGKFAPSLGSPIEGLEWVESQFDFETQVGRGSGMIRLTQGPDGVWKGQMIYTALQELKGFEDKVGSRRPHGSDEMLLDGGFSKGNWQDRRQKQIEFLEEEPTVLIVGAGQSGLNLGARLQATGVSCLLVDKNARVGDNWRNRYNVH